MKRLVKILVSLVLALTMLLTCMLVVVIILFVGWLRTYQAFTAEKLVAEITVEKTTPANGLERIKVTYTPITNDAALNFIIPGSESVTMKAEEFTLYGDQVLVGGPVVKFENIPVLLGFETAYKVARIQGSFINTAKANQIPSGNIHDLNGGIDPTWTHFEADADQLPWLIDTAYFSIAGKSAQSSSRSYGLYITEDGFILDNLE